MKLLLTIIALIAATSAATIKSIEPTTIDLKTLEQRVYAEYGEGDAGIEQMLYLTTGKHVDFMGSCAPVQPRDYQITINETGTYVYCDGKFVDYEPYFSVKLIAATVANDNI